MSPAQDRRRGNGDVPDEDPELELDELARQPRKPPIRKPSRRRNA